MTSLLNAVSGFYSYCREKNTHATKWTHLQPKQGHLPLKSSQWTCDSGGKTRDSSVTDKMTFSCVNTWPVLCLSVSAMVLFRAKEYRKLQEVGWVVSEMKYKIAQYVGYKGFNANPIISLLQLLKIWDLFSSLSEFRVAFAKIEDIRVLLAQILNFLSPFSIFNGKMISVDI